MRWLIVAVTLIVCLVPASWAAIFGNNDLDALTQAGTPNQCYLSGGSALPAGRIYVGAGADRRFAGSGATVGAADIVVTAAHLMTRIVDGGRVRFVVWEGTPDDCREVTYDATAALIGTRHPVQDPSRDYAVLKLSAPVAAYSPLKLGSSGAAAAARAGGSIRIAGFAGHPSTRLGRDLSMVSCRGYAMPVWDPQWRVADSLIVFNCDTATGMSGAPIIAGRTMIGIVTGAMNYSEGAAFNLTDNFNFGYAVEPTLANAVTCMRKGTGCGNFEVLSLAD